IRAPSHPVCPSHARKVSVMVQSSRAFAGVIALLSIQLGCNDRREAARSRGSAALISDGAHGSGNAHFFFLPPLVSSPTFSGAFDPTISPVVTVCQLSADACSPVVAQFSMTTGTA